MYASLGSNQGNPEENLNEALARLEAYGDDISLKGMSEYYETEPQDNREQPWFLNQVVEFEIDPVIWSPEGFLSAFQAIEAKMGRVHDGQKGPRSIDMDLLYWEGLEQQTEYLTLPHPAMRYRAFVLIPLQELAPDLVLAGGESIAQALAKLDYRVEGNKIWQKQ